MMEEPVYEKKKTNERPKRSRKAVSRFELTPEWAALRRDLEKPLKPAKGKTPGDSLQVAFTDDEKKKYGIGSRRLIAVFLKKYLESKGLDHVVLSFRFEDRDYVVIEAKV